jgi:hypothetical protein
MTYMRSWKSHRLTSHTWLGLNPQIGRPLSKIVGAIGLFVFFIFKIVLDLSCSPVFHCKLINSNNAFLKKKIKVKQKMIREKSKIYKNYQNAKKFKKPLISF